jgi:hypothetical protein
MERERQFARSDKTRDGDFSYRALMKPMANILIVPLIVTFITITTVAAAENDPETVLVTYHVKSGKTDELAKLIDRTWATYQRLGLVFDQPHLVMRGTEKGGDFFAEILPWKSHSAPDNAPAEVHALWDEMQTLCEKRGGREGIEIPEVQIVRSSK